MEKQEAGTKKRGRPLTGPGKQVQVRLNPQQLRIVERVARTLHVSNPEALRRMCFAEAAE